MVQLRTNAESVQSFFDCVMKVFQNVNRDRLSLVTEAFEKAGGLDELEKFQRDSQNETVI